MSWLKNKIRRWLESDGINIAEDRAYAPQPATYGDSPQTTVQMLRAMNGTVLILHTPVTAVLGKGPARGSGTTLYVLKDGESVQDAVATLLVKARLDSM